MATLKTSVYLEASDYRRLKALADAEGGSAAELIRAAVYAYGSSRPPTHLPSSLGAGRSGESDLSERVEGLLQEPPKEIGERK